MIEYVCPQCKQFNPSRKSKKAMISQAVGGGEEKKEQNLSVVDEEEDEVIEKLKAQVESDEDKTIGARVRQRHIEQED